LGKDRVHEENKQIGQKIWNLVLLTISSLVRVPVLLNQQASTYYTKCSCKPTHHPQIPIYFIWMNFVSIILVNSLLVFKISHDFQLIMSNIQTGLHFGHTIVQVTFVEYFPIHVFV
jgi:hypothetical protein